MSHHPLWHRPKTSDGSLLPPGLGGHKVSFSGSSKSTDKRQSARPSSRPSTSSNSPSSSPAPQLHQRRTASIQRPGTQTRPSQQPWNETRNLQRINRQSEALSQYALNISEPKPCPLTPHTPDLLSSPLRLPNPNRSSSTTIHSSQYSVPILLCNASSKTIALPISTKLASFIHLQTPSL